MNPFHGNQPRPSLSVLLLWYVRSLFITPALAILIFSLAISFIFLIIGIQEAAPDSQLQAPLVLILIAGLVLPGTLASLLGGFFGPLVLWLFYSHIAGLFEKHMHALRRRFAHPVRALAIAMTVWYGAIGLLIVLSGMGGTSDALLYILILYIASILSALYMYGVNILFQKVKNSTTPPFA